MSTRELYIERLIKEIPFEGLRRDIQKIFNMEMPPPQSIVRSDFNRNIFYTFWESDRVVVHIKIPEYIDEMGHVHEFAPYMFMFYINDKLRNFDKLAYNKLIQVIKMNALKK